MKSNKKIMAFTLSEMIVVLILTSIVIGLAFSVLNLVQKQMSAIQDNYNKSLELNKLETALWLDFNRYSDIRFNELDNELSAILNVSSILIPCFIPSYPGWNYSENCLVTCIPTCFNPIFRKSNYIYEYMSKTTKNLSPNLREVLFERFYFGIDFRLYLFYAKFSEFTSSSCGYHFIQWESYFR